VFRGHFEGRRALREFATAGQPVSYQVSVRNCGTCPQDGLSFEEKLSDPCPDWHTFSMGQGSSIRRWLGLMATEARVDNPPTTLPMLAPGESVCLKREFVPPARGTVRFDGICIARADPLGLFRGLVDVVAPASLLVLPKRYRIPELALPGFRRYQHGGVTQATSVGESEEFLGLRDYREGDPLQHIHWKSFARTGKPVVREYQDEFFERHALILDTCALDGEALEEAVSIAASLACTIETRDSLLDLLFVNGTSYTYTLGRGQQTAESLLEVLAHVRPSPLETFPTLHEAVVAHGAAVSSALLLLTGWDDARRGLVEDLQAAGLELLALLIVSEESAPSPGESPPYLRLLRPGHIESDLAVMARAK